MAPYLTLPSLQRRMSFEQALRDASVQEQRYEFGAPGDISPLEYGVERYITEMPGYARGEGLPSWWVAQTIRWLIVDDQFVGQIKRRHELNDYLTTFGGHIGYLIAPARRHQGRWTKMLALAKKKRKEEWVAQVLITCNEKNIGSRKIIETNGGVYFSKIRSDEEQDMKLRYWLYL
jgi:predicted acetyltransferase